MLQEIPEQETIKTVLFHGTALWESFKQWGEVLQTYNGEVKTRSEDVVTNYLGYWTDNGAYYYYNPLPNKTYKVVTSIMHTLELVVYNFHRIQ